VFLLQLQGYAPIRTPARKLMSTPTPFGGTPMYSIPEENRSQTYDVPQQLEGLPDMKPEDQQYFGALLKVRSTQLAGNVLQLPNYVEL
jgi:splicing factor 3B subunit 1